MRLDHLLSKEHLPPKGGKEPRFSSVEAGAHRRRHWQAFLGNGRRENIEIAGDVALADQRWGFSVGDNGASMVGDVMWFGPLKRFQKLFFRTPLVNLFVLGSEAYHDYYRWPLRDRRVFEQWRQSTHWGHLFEHYQAHGTLAPVEIASTG